MVKPRVLTFLEDELYYVLDKITSGPWKDKWNYAGEHPISPGSIELIPNTEKTLSTQVKSKHELGAIIQGHYNLYSQALDYAKTCNADYAALDSASVPKHHLPKCTEIEKDLWNVEDNVVLFRKK